MISLVEEYRFQEIVSLSGHQGMMMMTLMMVTLIQDLSTCTNGMDRTGEKKEYSQPVIEPRTMFLVFQYRFREIVSLSGHQIMMIMALVQDLPTCTNGMDRSGKKDKYSQPVMGPG